MVAFTFLLLPLLSLPILQSTALFLPNGPLIIPIPDPKKILCQLFRRRFDCPQDGPPAVSRITPLGIANGIQDPKGAYRFSVRYARASRWQPANMVSSWDLPNGFTNSSLLPLACPQSGVDPSTYSEDCLSMVLYVPPNLQLLSDVPVLVWIHGGSFVVGSASAPGLDGSQLAIATNSIIAVVQYRLGALSFMGNIETNLGVKDVAVALQFLKKVAPAFGASASKFTVAGQSSGANMIRALLASQTCSALFRSAILQSDPMNFGFLSTPTQTTLQNYYNTLTNCGGTDTACQNSLSLSTILSAQDTFFATAVDHDPAAGRNQPLRIVHDGNFISSKMDSSSSMASTNKPLLITTVKEEAGFAIYNMFPDVPDPAWLNIMASVTFDPGRANQVLTASQYIPVAAADGSVDVRITLQQMGTDYLWKCSAWTFARNWAQSGGTAYVGEFDIGAMYPGNEAVQYCTQPGVVCHQDDIEIIFGTVANPTSAQTALINEMQKRYKSFLATGNPNAPGSATWTKATNPNVQPLVFGGSGQVPVGACDPSFWGSEIKYDYQFYNQ